jgi:hypothetical protein
VKQFRIAVAEAGLVVARAIDVAPFGVGADDESDRAVAVDVVEAVLRIVLNNENASVFPKLAVADRFDDFS